MSSKAPRLPLLAALLLAAPDLYAQQAPVTVTVPALTPDLATRIDDIEQQARIANRRAELLEEAAATKKKEAPTFYADEKGFGLASVDKAYEIKIRGLVQADGRRAMDNSDPAVADRDTFVVRRLRPILDGTVLGLVDFRLMPDFGNGTVALLDGYVDAHPRPWLRLRAGKFKPPIGLERLQNDAYLPLIERSLDANLTAQRDTGVQLWGDIANGVIRYEIGVFNGVPDTGQNDVDNNHAKSYAGRIFVRPFQLEGLRRFGDLGVGFAVMTGNEKGTPTLVNGSSNTWLNPFRSAGQATIFSYLSNTADPAQTVFAFRRHTRLNPELYYYFDSFGLLAEWVKEYQELGKGTLAPGAVNNNSGHVTVSYVFGGDNSYDGARPKQVADWATKSIGAVEIAARYNFINFDDVSFQGAGLADATKSVTYAQGVDVGVNWYLSRAVKISGSWSHTAFQGGSSARVAGKPVVTDRPTEKILAGRFQVNF